MSTNNSIGSRLRDARERRRLTRRQVADATKLSIATLRRLEEDAFDLLPGGIYARAYVRAFAEAVGLDPEEAVRSFVRDHPNTNVTSDTGTVTRPFALPDRTVRREWLAIAILVAFGVGVIRLLSMATTPAAAPPGAVSTRAHAPVEVEADDVVTETTARAGLRLDIFPTGDCWVSAVADGESTMVRLLHSGDHVAVGARTELRLRIGDPGTFAYTVNGPPGRPLGEPGRPTSVTITVDNVGSFAADAPAPSRQGPPST